MSAAIDLRKRLGGHVGATQDKVHYGRIWPNGNFAVGLGPAGQLATECESDSECSMAVYGAAGPIGDAVAALTSSSVANSVTEPQAPTQRGLGGLTGYGSQMLRSSCYVLERDYGNADLCFATLTVPTLTRQGRVTLARNWSELVTQLLRWVSRQLMKSGRPTKVCGCVEIQTSRLASRGEAYLHLHLVWPAHSNSAGRRWCVEWEDIHRWWGQALRRFSGEVLSHNPRVELAPVRKSAERYMGKYLSKGSGESLDQYIADLGVESVPSAWWFATATLKHQVRDELCKGKNTGELLNMVIQAALEEGDITCFEWMRPVELQYDDRVITVGWCGRLKPWLRDDLLGMLAPLVGR